MSDTVTAPAPAQAPVVPSAPVTPTMPGAGFGDRIKSIAARTKVDAPAPVTDKPAVVIQRTQQAPVDAPGSHDAPPGSVAPSKTLQETVAGMSAPSNAVQPDAVATDTAPASPEAAPATEPTGEISIDDGDITLTAQRNPDGTFKTKLDPNEKVDFTVKAVIDPETGKPKVYSKTLPELARMAKESIVLQQAQGELRKTISTLEPEVEYYRKNVPEWQQSDKTLREQLEAQRALNLELLTADPDVVNARRGQYAEEMSPEKQLERLRAERAAELAERQKAEEQKQRDALKMRHDTVAKSFLESRIAPALAAAEQSVSPEAVTGKVTMLTHDLVVNGVIPPANWPEMERRITSPAGPFQTWLQAESAKRTQDTDAVKQAREKAEAEQRRAQSVVNETGRAIAPIGRAGADTAQTPAKPTTVQGVIERMVRRPLPDSMQRTG